MNDLIVWVLSILAALLGGGYLRQKSKAKKAQLKQAKAEAGRHREAQSAAGKAGIRDQG